MPEDLIPSMTTAFTSIQGEMLDAIGAIAPIAIVVMAAILVWKFGIRFFKSVVK